MTSPAQSRKPSAASNEQDGNSIQEMTGPSPQGELMYDLESLAKEQEAMRQRAAERVRAEAEGHPNVYGRPDALS